MSCRIISAGLRTSRRVSLAPVLLFAGCKAEDYSAFFPAGTVGEYERDLMILTLGLMLFVFVPVFFLTLFFSWRYRARNTLSRYAPDWSHSSILELFLWGGPVVIIAILGFVTWYSSYQLDPYRPLHETGSGQPIQVDVIGMDWKWLFIYPQYDVAAVNEMALPLKTPVSLRLTSDTVMMGLMVPALGSQIMVMSGMQTRLHLNATQPGVFFGKNYQYSGNGFADERFRAIATSRDGFLAWVDKARASGQALDAARYAALTKPGEAPVVEYFSSVKPHLFDEVIKRYHDGKPRNQLTKTAER